MLGLNVFSIIGNSMFTGEDFGKIVIWNMEPVRDEAVEADEKVPKILCQMDHHSGLWAVLLLPFVIFSIFINFKKKRGAMCKI